MKNIKKTLTSNSNNNKFYDWMNITFIYEVQYSK